MSNAGSFTSLIINQHRFKVELPTTVKEYYQGLMYRHHLPLGQGMLFFFLKDQENKVVMWMKHTYIPLDMLFIGPDFRIQCIRHAKPRSLKLIGCDKPTWAVLELNAGEAGEFGLAVGMRIYSKISA